MAAPSRKSEAKPKPARKKATKPVSKPKMGRPSDYTLAKANTICTRLTEGESLVQILKTEGMPSMPTFFSWIEKNPDFLNKYEKAKEAQAERLFSELLEISDEKDVEATYDGEEVTLALSSAAIARNRLRVDTRKWVLSKMLPKKFGDKTTAEVTGADGGPIKHAFEIAFVKGAQ